MSFSELMLSIKLQETIKALGYTKPTEIQQKSIPLLLQRKDILATSQTGTGKTASFVLPMLENLKEESEKKTGDERYKINALILAPTRELVIQIQQRIEEYGAEFTHKSVALYGGVKLGSQIKEIRSGANIAVATTGRLLEHIKNRSINLSQVEMIILDEADKMLEMGFINDIRSILSALPKKIGDKRRHSVMFSATFPPTIMRLAKSFLENPITIEIDKENLSAQQVEQSAYLVEEEKKLPLLSDLILSEDWHQILIFTNTKLKADQIVEHLTIEHISSLAIHGNKNQKERIHALQKFKERKIRVLVATDIAARGIDIIDLPFVINFELPVKNEDYIHRIGRTGRAEKNGQSISLVCNKEQQQLKEIEILINKKLSKTVLNGYIESNIETETKREKPKKNINLKKAKELAQKMMKKENKSDKNIKTAKKDHYKSPKNKRLF